jgi:hypothetical protein
MLKLHATDITERLRIRLADFEGGAEVAAKGIHAKIKPEYMVVVNAA